MPEHLKNRTVGLITLSLVFSICSALLPAGNVDAALLDLPAPWINFIWQVPLHNGAPICDEQTSADTSSGGAAAQPDDIDIASGAAAGSVGPGNEPSCQVAYYDGGTPGNTNIADDFLAFRMRLSGDPQNPGNGDGYKSRHWCILIDVDEDGWKEFVIDLTGAFSGNSDDRLYLFYNNNNSNEVDPATDQIEAYYAASAYAAGAPQTYNHTRVVIPAAGGADNTQVWLDMQIPLTSLRNSSGVQQVLPTQHLGIYMSTSASNTDPLQKDWMIAAVDFVPVPMSDLALTKSDTPDPTYTGGPLTYNLTVTNNGPGTAVNVVVTEAYPAGFFFGSATPPPDVNTDYKWIFAKLDSGESETITITGTAISAEGIIINSASVTSSTNDPNYDNNSTTQSTTVTPVADVAIAKSDSPDPVNEGGTLTYNLTLNNYGPSTASNIVVMENYSSGFSFVSANIAPDLSTDNKWTFSTLASGESETITITGTAIFTGLSLTNTATVSSSNYDPVLGNNTATEKTTVTPIIAAPVIAANKTDSLFTDADSNGAPSPGDTLLYTITLTNSSNAAATGILFSDTPDSDTTLVTGSVQTSQGAVTGGNAGLPPVTVDIRSIQGGGGSVAITFKVTINSPLPQGVTSVANQGIVSSNGLPEVLTDDPNVPGDNNPTVTQVTAAPAIADPFADVTIIKTADTGSVTEGSELRYALIVTNNGPGDAENVTVIESYPDGFTYSTANPLPTSGNNVWTLGTLVAGTHQTITITGIVTAATGLLTNTANVKSSTNDPDLDNNAASKNTMIRSILSAGGNLIIQCLVLSASFMLVSIVLIRRRARR